MSWWNYTDPGPIVAALRQYGSLGTEQLLGYLQVPAEHRDAAIAALHRAGASAGFGQDPADGVWKLRGAATPTAPPTAPSVPPAVQQPIQPSAQQGIPYAQPTSQPPQPHGQQNPQSGQGQQSGQQYQQPSGRYPQQPGYAAAAPPARRGLSGGAITGIVLGAVAVLAVIVLVIVLIWVNATPPRPVLTGVPVPTVTGSPTPTPTPEITPAVPEEDLTFAAGADLPGDVELVIVDRFIGADEWTIDLGSGQLRYEHISTGCTLAYSTPRERATANDDDRDATIKMMERFLGEELSNDLVTDASLRFDATGGLTSPEDADYEIDILAHTDTNPDGSVSVTLARHLNAIGQLLLVEYECASGDLARDVGPEIYDGMAVGLARP